MVDSASVDPAVAAVATKAGAEVVRAEQPGLGRARNLGLRRVQEDVVAFTDDDCLVAGDWLETLVGEFAQPDPPAFVTGQVRPDVDEPRRAWLPVSVTDGLEARALGPGDDVRRFGHGANMAWNRAALERIGGFDDRLGVGSTLRAAEDVDAWWRALDAGFTGRYTPDAMVVHRQWRDRAAMLRSYYGYGVGAGALAVKRFRMASAGAGNGLRRGSARRALLRALLVDDGPGRALRSLGRGHEMAAVADGLLFLGAQRGAVAASRLSVDAGHFA